MDAFARLLLEDSLAVVPNPGEDPKCPGCGGEQEYYAIGERDDGTNLYAWTLFRHREMCSVGVMTRHAEVWSTQCSLCGEVGSVPAGVPQHRLPLGELWDCPSCLKKAAG